MGLVEALERFLVVVREPGVVHMALQQFQLFGKRLREVVLVVAVQDNLAVLVVLRTFVVVRKAFQVLMVL